MRLFLCEKPSQAKDIARILNARQRDQGCWRGPDVTVTWCIGHLLESAPPEDYDPQYKRWTLDQLPLIPQHWRKTIKPEAKAQFAHVRHLISAANELVIATDADREGEMIACEILEYCQWKGPTLRLWLSALNDASIRKALSDMKPASVTRPLYMSALARSRADWLIGINCTRLFTLLGRQAGFQDVLTVGRVQTPTLRLVTLRDNDIAAFIPTPYWRLSVQLSHQNATFRACWSAPEQYCDEQGRCIQQRAAQDACSVLQSAPDAQVVTITTKTVSEPAPLPFALSELQAVCSRTLALDVQETLNIAQSLYEAYKVITYPRTDSGFLPENMHQEAPAITDALLHNLPELAQHRAQLDLQLRNRAWNDARITAHHGMIPTSGTLPSTPLPAKVLAVYRLIGERWLAQFLPDYQAERTTIAFDCHGLTLTSRGRRITQSGWRQIVGVTGEDDNETEETLPLLRQGDRCRCQQTTLQTLKTTPPPPWTQGELVKAMKGIARFVVDPRLRKILHDTTGIGTEATRAAIINGLLQRGYLLKQGRAIRASPAAHSLINALPEALSDPGTTALWEQALMQIEKNERSPDSFIAHQAELVRQIVAQYRHAQLTFATPETPVCPQCQATMRQRKGKNGVFWSCTRYPDCRGTRPVESATKAGRSRKKR
ncbi:TPA: DNA topoisomerase III [Klebsiella quasipneumoniae subsp. quasipneumoniae]|nr:DNA topoisomerase III [Klebsiella quasipneumoniae subsp. similipneumoniae]HBR1460279.1 DNA topoisomerase III [Klebsiella quasipneumoniae subsp. quasipneumoniae]HBR2034388.1 DNA topoisomerase III [Klebsiella quasipneumoniae subsp. quasipneumoniae]HCI6432395.1 DNA topoisomerase III [Klebsiella quasipneumoniae subsp. similipneumoniae]